MSSKHYPLVLVPGAMAIASSWIYQTQEFERDRTVIVPDGHYQLPSIVAMAEKIADEVPKQFDLVGWSMGGYIALELCRLVHLRIRRLVLLSTSVQAESEATQGMRRTTLRAIEADGLAAAWDRSFALAIAHPESLSPGIKARLRADHLALGVDTYRSQAFAMMNRRDSRSVLTSIKAPVLTMTGQLDTVIPVERSVEIASELRCQLEIVPDVGHCLPLEAPNLCNQYLHQFLDNERHPPSSILIDESPPD